jgi:uncharacterized protein YcfJ
MRAPEWSIRVRRAVGQALMVLALSLALVGAGPGSAEGQQLQFLGQFGTNVSPGDVSATATWPSRMPRPLHLLHRRQVSDGERGALLGAAVGGIGLALLGSQLCERNKSCTGTVIGFALVGATVGAVIGAFAAGHPQEGS